MSLASPNHVNVLIATPGYSLLGGYVHSLLATSQLLSEHNLTFAFLNAYSSHVSDAREVTLSGTYTNDITNSKPLGGQLTYDTILWIDSDIVWNPEDALKLINSDKEITTGVYLFGDGTTSAYPEKLKKGYQYNDIMQKTEKEKIFGCGFGFIAVKNGVFEKMPRPWFQSQKTSVDIDGKLYDFNIIGEDLSWCLKVQELGFDIWLDPTVRVIHHKTMKLTWEGIQP